MKLNKKGFTLIELLIVIVIIGILVAVLIAVINPARARGRAKDAGIEATMNKIALSAQGTMSAYGLYPDCSELEVDLSGLIGNTASPITGGCEFGFEAIDATDDAWKYYFVNGPVAGDEYFYITHPSAGLGGTTNFVYHSSQSGKIFACTDLSGVDVVDWTPDTSVCKDLTNIN